MKSLGKYSLYLLSAYAAGVAGVSALRWDDLLVTQKLVAIATVIFTLHEWEEQRFPGGFLEMMGEVLNINIANVNRHAIFSKPDVLVAVMTLTALVFKNVPLFSCAVLIVGLFEGIVHVVGIKRAKRTKPYTPGMVTGEIYAVLSVVGIVLIARSGAATALDWVLGMVWSALCGAVMEIAVWKAAGISIKDFPQKFRALVGK